jgi:hypothetical protein
VFRYLKAAFWASPTIPGVGRIPVNALAVAGLLILGFGHEGFWLLGAGLEAAYLYALARNERFRRVVDAEDLQIEENSAEQQREVLVASLTPDRRDRLQKVEKLCLRIMQLHRDSQTEDFLIEANAEALKKLSWLHLKLLVAQQNLESLHATSAEVGLKRQIELIQKDLQHDKISPSLKESKKATLAILQQRLANLDRREQSLEEIESDLTRIEAQVDLALENAGMRGKPETISANIDLVSHLLDDSIYGDSGASIAAVDQSFQQRQ